MKHDLRIALELACHPTNDLERVEIGQKLIPFLLAGENIDTGALRILAEHKPTHGGKRPGAGRKPTGKASITSSINLTPEDWAKLDALRGEKSRSAWISERIRKAKAP